MGGTLGRPPDDVIESSYSQSNAGVQTSTTAADAGATTSDGNNSDGRPKGHPLAWRPKGCFDAQRWPGTGNDCSNGSDGSYGSGREQRLPRRASID